MNRIFKNTELIDFYDWQWRDFIVNESNVYKPIETYTKKIYDHGGVTFVSFEPDSSLSSDFSLERVCAVIRSIRYKENKIYGNIEFIDNEYANRAMKALEDGTHKWDVTFKTKRGTLTVGDREFSEVSSFSGFSIIKKK